MKNDFEDCTALLSHAEAHNLYRALLAQLQKDFARAGLDGLFAGSGAVEILPPEPLVQMLRERIYRLLLENFDGYLNLMYAADVREAEFRNLSLTDAVEVADQIVMILLLREWKKVWFRKSEGQK